MHNILLTDLRQYVHPYKCTVNGAVKRRHFGIADFCIKSAESLVYFNIFVHNCLLRSNDFSCYCNNSVFSNALLACLYGINFTAVL